MGDKALPFRAWRAGKAPQELVMVNINKVIKFLI